MRGAASATASSPRMRRLPTGSECTFSKVSP